jgi:hypothetical protein
MNKLEQLKETIEGIEISYDYEDAYTDLINATIDYQNETQDWCFEYLFEDIIDYDTAEEIAKHEIDKGGLLRLYYFLGDANLNNALFRIDGYGNLTDVSKEDLECLKDEILNLINNKLEENNELL